MTVNVGTMQLPVPEDPDAVRTYLNGTHVSGGLWTALTRSSNHDHSGGTNGIQLTATSIPDGSITTAKLDPAVLGPYALVDGSKPFTGTVTMSADTLVRDTLRFGAKPAGVADATLSRTGAGALRVDTHLGVGVAPATWAATLGALQIKHAAGVSLYGGDGFACLANNTVDDGSPRAGAAYAASNILLVGGGMQFRTAPSVAAGAAQTFTTRLALAPTGTLTLTPDAAAPALSAVVGAGGATFQIGIGSSSATAPCLYTAGALEVDPAASVFIPRRNNAIACGYTGYLWTAVYATAGAINTSLAEAKEGITALDPLACYEAAKAVKWFAFAYLPPAYQEPEPPPEIAYDAADDNETKAEKKAKRDEAEAQARAAHLKMVAETAPARNQRGFVFPTGAESKDEAGGTLPPVPDLFGLDDRESTTPQADIATLGAALQYLIMKVEALEAAQA